MLVKKYLDYMTIAFWVIAIVMYDVTFELIQELLHLCLEVVHNLFEVFELAIEHTIEHLFHTSRHTTQVITFYIIMAIAAVLLYRLVKVMPGVYRTVHDRLLAYWVRRKTQVQLFWLSQTLLNKVALIAGGLVVAYLASFFVM